MMRCALLCPIGKTRAELVSRSNLVLHSSSSSPREAVAPTAPAFLPRGNRSPAGKLVRPESASRGEVVSFPRGNRRVPSARPESPSRGETGASRINFPRGSDWPPNGSTTTPTADRRKGPSPPDSFSRGEVGAFRISRPRGEVGASRISLPRGSRQLPAGKPARPVGASRISLPRGNRFPAGKAHDVGALSAGQRSVRSLVAKT